MGLRVTDEEELAGVDASECGLEAYQSSPHPSSFTLSSHGSLGPYPFFLGV